MILGLSTYAFTVLHVVVSLIAIAAGFVVVFGMFGSNRLRGWTALFLAATILTTVTGFLFPINGFTPALAFGVISSLLLAAALLALYAYGLAGAWRWIYVASAILALYLNVVVGIVQSFQKLAFLRPLAPTQSEPPFLVAQIVVLVIFIVLGIAAVRKFHPEAKAALERRLSM
jgi:hypothetical protein